MNIVGTWGNGIFDDEVALAIKDEFENDLKAGLSINIATARILQAYSDMLDDEDEGPIVYLSLAVLQIEHESLHQEIKVKALEIIETGQGLTRWEEAGGKALANRKQTLANLKFKLSNK